MPFQRPSALPRRPRERISFESSAYCAKATAISGASAPGSAPTHASAAAPSADERRVDRVIEKASERRDLAAPARDAAVREIARRREREDQARRQRGIGANREHEGEREQQPRSVSALAGVSQRDAGAIAGDSTTRSPGSGARARTGRS